MKINAQQVARIVCWSVRHPMQYGVDATPQDAESAVRDMGMEVTQEIKDEIAKHMKRWQSLGRA